jgi:hypothetical protein
MSPHPVDIYRVYGFTLNNREFLKLILAQVEKDPDFAGEIYMIDPSEKPEDFIDECEIDAMCCMEGENGVRVFHELKEDFIFHNESAQVKARALFPELPGGIKLFYNANDHKDTWHLGIQTSTYSSEWFAEDVDEDTSEPIPLESCEERLSLLFQRYGRYFKEKDQKPVECEVTDCCLCCF